MDWTSWRLRDRSEAQVVNSNILLKSGFTEQHGYQFRVRHPLLVTAYTCPLPACFKEYENGVVFADSSKNSIIFVAWTLSIFLYKMLFVEMVSVPYVILIRLIAMGFSTVQINSVMLFLQLIFCIYDTTNTKVDQECVRSDLIPDWDGMMQKVRDKMPTDNAEWEAFKSNFGMRFIRDFAICIISVN